MIVLDNSIGNGVSDEAWDVVRVELMDRLLTMV
jgi:hypothetical protein